MEPSFSSSSSVVYHDPCCQSTGGKEERIRTSGKKGYPIRTSPAVTSGSEKETWRSGLVSAWTVFADFFDCRLPKRLPPVETAPSTTSSTLLVFRLRIYSQRSFTSSMGLLPNAMDMRLHGTRKAIRSRRTRSSLTDHTRSLQPARNMLVLKTSSRAAARMNLAYGCRVLGYFLCLAFG